MADALATTIRSAPEQWYSFKPMWPATEAAAADLERRAGVMLAGLPDPGPGRGLPPDEADGAAEEAVGVTLRSRGLIAASWLACHLPEGPLTRLADLAGDAWYRLAPARAAQARRNLARVAKALDATGRGSAAVRAAAQRPARARTARARRLPAQRAVLPRGRADTGPDRG